MTRDEQAILDMYPIREIVQYNGAMRLEALVQGVKIMCGVRLDSPSITVMGVKLGAAYAAMRRAILDQHILQGKGGAQ